MLKYPYSSGNLLKKPQKYQMSPFQGKIFLSSYFNSRKKIIQIIEKNKQNHSDEILNQFIKSINIKHENFSENIFLEKFLLFLLSNLLKMTKDPKIDEYVDKFLKKFEIKKRLYSIYNLKFQEQTEDYTNIRNYILLSIIFQKKYEQTKILKYLNSVLKLDDILCSQVNNFNSQDHELVYHLLNREIYFVSELCNKKGIDFP